MKPRNWSAQRDKARIDAILVRRGAKPIDPQYLMLRFTEALPRDAVVVDEGLTSRNSLPKLLAHRDRATTTGCASGGLGFAMPGAVGVRAGRRRRGPWLLSATAAPCTASRDCGPPRTTGCRSPTSSPTTAATASSRSACLLPQDRQVHRHGHPRAGHRLRRAGQVHGDAGGKDHRARCGPGGAAAPFLTGPKLLDVVVEGRV